MMGEVELKPCPFCGGEVIDVLRFQQKLIKIRCWNCTASVSGKNEKEAIEKWNTRGDN